MKSTVKILFVLLAALTAQTAPAQEFNVCPLGGIIYQHGNVILRDRDGDISEQQVQDFQARGLRFRVHPAHLAGPHGETGRYRTVTLKVVFGTAYNGGPSRALEFSVPDETNRTAFAGTSPWRFELRNLATAIFTCTPITRLSTRRALSTRVTSASTKLSSRSVEADQLIRKAEVG